MSNWQTMHDYSSTNTEAVCVKCMQTPYEIGPELTSKTELLDKADEARDAFLESQDV